jgi:hypothetical protein
LGFGEANLNPVFIHLIAKMANNQQMWKFELFFQFAFQTVKIKNKKLTFYSCYFLDA